MKKVILTASTAFLLTGLAHAQFSKLSNPLTTDYRSLINKDMPSVMNELKLSAKDTVGKTGKAIYPKIDPVTPLTTLTTKTGEKLAFKANKLVAIIPKP